jgi:hypothetical protein
MANQIKYYPVDNGDQSLITVTEGDNTINILVDCNIRETSKGDTDPSQYDVKKDLDTTLKKKKVQEIEGVPYVDVYVLTHGDDDHLHGFEKNFYQGDPRKFRKKHKDDGLIFIDVLWFSPKVMGECTNPDEECFKKEAKRRIQLHQDNSPDKDLPGNRVVIIGYDENEDLSGLDLVRRIPGDIVTRFNNLDLSTFSIFIHAPFKEHLDNEEAGKNHTSIVFQARWKETAYSSSFSALAMFGGDADHYAWKKILEETKKSLKDLTESALKWDLFLAPHHCSWTFFNDTPQEDNPDPVATSLEILDNRRSGGKVVVSSKEIKDDDDNPPHYAAKEQYLGKVEKSSRLLNTASNKVDGNPVPIVFTITVNGPSKMPDVSSGGALTSAGGSGAAGRSAKQGGK